MWVLKQDVHRGKGVHVMKQQDAIHEVQLPVTCRPCTHSDAANAHELLHFLPCSWDPSQITAVEHQSHSNSCIDAIRLSIKISSVSVMTQVTRYIANLHLYCSESIG